MFAEEFTGSLSCLECVNADDEKYFMCYTATALLSSPGCGFIKARCRHSLTQTHAMLKCVVGAAAVALTTVSLFSKRKAADVSRGSDRGEWNVGAIFELNTHTYTKPSVSSVSSCSLYLSLSPPCHKLPELMGKSPMRNKSFLSASLSLSPSVSAPSICLLKRSTSRNKPLFRQVSYWIHWLNMRKRKPFTQNTGLFFSWVLLFFFFLLSCCLCLLYF